MNRRRFLSFVASVLATVPLVGRLVRVHGHVVLGETFTGGTILVPGTFYVDCVFQDCRFSRAYPGDDAPITVERSLFYNCGQLCMVTVDAYGERFGDFNHLKDCRIRVDSEADCPLVVTCPDTYFAGSSVTGCHFDVPWKKADQDRLQALANSFA